MNNTKYLHLPTPMEVELAKNSSRILPKYAGQDSIQLTISSGSSNPEEIQLHGRLLQILIEVLTKISQVRAVSINTYQMELSVQECSNLLDVNRKFFEAILDSREIPHYQKGIQRRVLLKDLLEYKVNTEKARHRAMGELAQLSQDIGIVE